MSHAICKHCCFRALSGVCAMHFLQESLAEYVILWDDDIKPSPGCLAAYVQAFREHPEVRS
jgi:GT2 family glycosyltransferase